MKIAFKRMCVWCVVCVKSPRRQSASCPAQGCAGPQRPVGGPEGKAGVFIDEHSGWDRRLERVECIALPGPLTFASQWACPTNHPVCLHSFAEHLQGCNLSSPQSLRESDQPRYQRDQDSPARPDTGRKNIPRFVQTVLGAADWLSPWSSPGLAAKGQGPGLSKGWDTLFEVGSQGLRWPRDGPRGFPGEPSSLPGNAWQTHAIRFPQPAALVSTWSVEWLRNQDRGGASGFLNPPPIHKSRDFAKARACSEPQAGVVCLCLPFLILQNQYREGQPLASQITPLPSSSLGDNVFD